MFPVGVLAMIARWINCLMAFVLIVCAFSISGIDAPAVPPRHAYFPLRSGTTWKYRVMSETNDKAEKPFVQTLTAGEPLTLGDQSLIPIDIEVYQIKPDGVYLIGRRDAGKVIVTAFPEPQKILPSKPRSGEAWNSTAKSDSAYITCLGSQSIKTEAGEFLTQSLYSTGGTEAASQRQAYRYFARDVGLVRETITTKTRRADGSFDVHQVTRDLIAFSPPIEIQNPTIQAAFSMKPTSAGDPSPVDALFMAGKKLAADGDHKAALVKYAEALALDPKNAPALAYKAISLLAMGQTKAAQQASEEALKLNDKDAVIWEVVGQIKVVQNQPTQARAVFDKAAQLSPKTAGAMYMDLAAAFAGRNDNALAGEIESALKAAAAAEPPSGEALFQLGQSDANSGRQQGKAYLRRYIELAVKQPEAEQDKQKIQVAKQLIRALDALNQVK